MKQQIRFTIAAVAFAITAEIKQGRTGVEAFSITGDTAHSAGQITDSLRTLAEEHDIAPVITLCDLWDRWHLNDVRSGTPEQLAIARENKGSYLETVEALQAAGLLTVEFDGKPHTYGKGWITEPLPEGFRSTLTGLLAELDGKDFATEAVTDAIEPEDLSKWTQDVFDSRDLNERYEQVRITLESLGFDLTDTDKIDSDYLEDSKWAALLEEYAALHTIVEEGHTASAEWDHGATVIADSYFTEYAQEMAEDIGAIQRDAPWPACHIDWDAAAKSLQQDYGELTIDGHSYWVR